MKDELLCRQLENIEAAIPVAPAAPMSTMEIWHAAKHPKLPFNHMKRYFRAWSDANDGLKRVGNKTGVQRYVRCAEAGPSMAAADHQEPAAPK